VQFLSGGWIENNLPEGTDRVSNTYVFPSDIGPTLLSMAGGNTDFLLKGKTGATYGNPMWEFLKNSVDPSQPASTHQKVRKVSYNKDIFFDVQLDKTLKNIFMGKVPQWTPRLWEPVWPKNGQLVMDSAYYSVQPCRPNGVASDCCLLNIEEDWQENNPLPADCQALSLEGKQLFVIEDGCPKNWKGMDLNPLCLQSGSINDGALPSIFSLWSHYGATGPFTNSRGVPIDDFPMKCACLAIDPSISASEADFFTLPIFSPTQCVNRGDYNFILQGVACDGTFSFGSPIKDLLQEFALESFDITQYQELITKEIKQRLALDLPGLVDTLKNYTERVGFTEWPNFAKFPFVVPGLDTCQEKNVTPVPWPVLSMTPYMLGIRDPTTPRLSDYKIGLCAINSLDTYFCPSHVNPLLDPVKEWNFGRRMRDSNDGNSVVSNVFGKNRLFSKGGLLSGKNGLFSRNNSSSSGLFNNPAGILNLKPYGIFADGRTWESMSLLDCTLKCPIQAQGTAYIGDGPHGLTV
jgi:hypothetical protein